MPDRVIGQFRRIVAPTPASPNGLAPLAMRVCVPFPDPRRPTGDRPLQPRCFRWKTFCERMRTPSLWGLKRRRQKNERQKNNTWRGLEWRRFFCLSFFCLISFVDVKVFRFQLSTTDVPRRHRHKRGR